MTKRSLRIIFDTNVWIGFLIGKRLSGIQQFIIDGRITVVFSPHLLEELTTVTSSAKLRRYFPKDKVDELILLLNMIGESVNTEPKHFDCRDPKDNFLLDLIDFSNADCLVTGDHDLLALKSFKGADILQPSDLELWLINKC